MNTARTQWLSSAVLLAALAGGAWGQAPVPSAPAGDPNLEITVKTAQLVAHPNPPGEPDIGPVYAVEIAGVDRSGAEVFAISASGTLLLDAGGATACRCIAPRLSTNSYDTATRTGKFEAALWFEPPKDLTRPLVLVVRLNRFKALRTPFIWESPTGLKFPLHGALPGLTFEVGAPFLKGGTSASKPATELAWDWTFDYVVTDAETGSPSIESLQLKTTEGKSIMVGGGHGDLSLTRLDTGLFLKHGVVTYSFPDEAKIPSLERVEMVVCRYLPYDQAMVPLPPPPGAE